MAGRQGFITNGVTYVYQETATSKSTALGIDTADSKWKISAKDGLGAIPSTGAQLTIDPATNGNMTLTPNGAGNLLVSYLTAGVVLSSSTGALTSSAGTINYVLTSNGAGFAPTFQANAALGGVTSITGTSNEIVASAATGAVTLSLSPTLIAPGTLKSTTTLAAGNLTAAGIVYNSVTTGILTSHTTTNHAIQLGNGTQLADLALGTQYQVLQSGGAADPAWSAYTLPATVAQGDILYATGTTAIAALTKSGTATRYLSNTGTTNNPAWAQVDLTDGVTGTLPVGNGGTSVTATTVGGILVGSSTSAFTNLVIGTNAFVLTSNGTTAAWAANAALGGVTSITGTANEITASAATGAVTLSTPSTFIAPGSIAATTTVTATLGDITITSGNLVLTAATTSSVGQIKQAGSRILHTFGTNNLFVGTGAGNFTLSAASSCTGVGSAALAALTNAGQHNTAMGQAAGTTITSGTDNTLIGQGAGYLIITGSNNTVIGGAVAGSGYTGAESSNILIGSANLGTVGESNVCRIGVGTGTSAGQLNKMFLAGTYNTAVGATAGVALIDSAGQIGGLAGTVGQMLQGGTKPAFSTATYPATVATGDVLYASTTNVVSSLAAGTNGYVLTMGASVPAWAAASGGGITFSIITADQTAVVNTGYICNKASALLLALPTTAAVGVIIECTGMNTALGWKITQAASQKIYFGTSTTTAGTGGYIQSSNIRDSVRLVCIVANLEFNVISSMGNVTIV